MYDYSSLNKQRVQQLDALFNTIKEHIFIRLQSAWKTTKTDIRYQQQPSKQYNFAAISPSYCFEDKFLLRQQSFFVLRKIPQFIKNAMPLAILLRDKCAILPDNHPEDNYAILLDNHLADN